MKTNLPMLFGLFVAVSIAALLATGSAVAQETLAPDELELQYGPLRTRSFDRDPSVFYDAVMQYSRMDPSAMDPADVFLRAYYEGRWDDVQRTLAMLPDGLANEVYDKMLSDLTGQDKPVVTLADFLGLTDACPGELERDRLRQLGLERRLGGRPRESRRGDRPPAERWR